MTKREQHLIIVVILFIIGWLVFRFWPRDDGNTKSTAVDYRFTLEEADRLLRSRQNIQAHHQAVRNELQAYQERFYPASHPENAKIALLKAVESLAVQTNLAVHQKNMVSIHEDTIGVALQGQTGSESLIRFLQLTSQNPIGLRIQRLQIHSVPETKQLNYQVTVITMLVKK